ncbi:Bifunctional enzyme Fae/Hps [uncultured archaeon]|nr:Bifunctional enzyme Fae/Hps [uncultured archaeon]
MFERFKDTERYLQIAFNDDSAAAQRLVSLLPKSDRILVEAGTPLIKREGEEGIRNLVDAWGGRVVADLKTMDGALEEVELAHSAGAFAATVLGAAATETQNIFIAECERQGMMSMIDMINVEEPLRAMMRLKAPPDVVVIHKGRDEETTRGKIIRYRNITKVKGKYDVMISVAGGVDLKEARSAIFNGANIVVVNVVTSSDPWAGIRSDEDVARTARKFLETIEA